ncbi:hypothetical protein I3760_04G085800 [Carya illinoinensis]|nr:hypothetical protein I3760_04G085800 [Carya illinoinensis]
MRNTMKVYMHSYPPKTEVSKEVIILVRVSMRVRHS